MRSAYQGETSIDLEDLFGTLKKLSNIVVVFRNFAQSIARSHQRYLNATVAILRLSNVLVFERLEELCIEINFLAPEDTQWVEEADTVREAVFRVLEFSKEVLSQTKVHFEGTEAELKAKWGMEISERVEHLGVEYSEQ